MKPMRMTIIFQHIREYIGEGTCVLLMCNNYLTLLHFFVYYIYRFSPSSGLDIKTVLKPQLFPTGDIEKICFNYS